MKLVGNAILGVGLLNHLCAVCLPALWFEEVERIARGNVLVCLHTTIYFRQSFLYVNMHFALLCIYGTGFSQCLVF